MRHDGSIGHDGLMAHLELESTLFSERLFEIVDLDQGGGISFTELVVACWQYCSLNLPDGLANFAFDLFDLDETGVLHKDELIAVLHAVYGTSRGNRARIAAIAEEEVHGDRREMTRERFAEFVRHHQMVMYPAFELYKTLRSHLGGNGFWHTIAQRRLRYHRTHNLHPNNWRRLLRQLEEAARGRRSRVDMSEVRSDEHEIRDWAPLTARMRRGSAAAAVLDASQGHSALAGDTVGAPTLATTDLIEREPRDYFPEDRERLGMPPTEEDAAAEEREREARRHLREEHRAHEAAHSMEARRWMKQWYYETEDDDAGAGRPASGVGYAASRGPPPPPPSRAAAAPPAPPTRRRASLVRDAKAMLREHA